jgi:hypothetical protein
MVRATFDAPSALFNLGTIIIVCSGLLGWFLASQATGQIFGDISFCMPTTLAVVQLVGILAILLGYRGWLRERSDWLTELTHIDVYAFMFLCATYAPRLNCLESEALHWPVQSWTSFFLYSSNHAAIGISLFAAYIFIRRFVARSLSSA